MKYLVFKLLHEDFSHAVAGSESIYLLSNSEYAVFRDVRDQEALKSAKRIDFKQLSSLQAVKKDKGLSLYNHSDLLLQSLSFESPSLRNQFIAACPDFKRVAPTSKGRIKPINATLVMLFAYSFVWAGTRQDISDINPEGIRWRIAYWMVAFLEWLNGFLGQRLLLGIGLMIVLALLYFIFSPEIGILSDRKLKFVNLAREAK